MNARRATNVAMTVLVAIMWVLVVWILTRSDEGNGEGGAGVDVDGRGPGGGEAAAGEDVGVVGAADAEAHDIAATGAARGGAAIDAAAQPLAAERVQALLGGGATRPAVDHERAVIDEADEADAPQGSVHAPDRQGIQAAMNEARPLIGECYDAWLRAHPELAGKLVVHFTINDPLPEDDEGLARVTVADIDDSTVDHALLEGCVMNVVAGLRFDPPESGKLRVSYPFLFDATPRPPR